MIAYACLADAKKQIPPLGPSGSVSEPHYPLVPGPAPTEQRENAHHRSQTASPDGVPQPRNQDTELAFVQVNPPDLVPVGEDDEGLEGVWRETSWRLMDNQRRKAERKVEKEEEG